MVAPCGLAGENPRLPEAAKGTNFLGISLKGLAVIPIKAPNRTPPGLPAVF